MKPDETPAPSEGCRDWYRSTWKSHDWIISYTANHRMCRNCRKTEPIARTPVPPTESAAIGSKSVVEGQAGEQISEKGGDEPCAQVNKEKNESGEKMSTSLIQLSQSSNDSEASTPSTNTSASNAPDAVQSGIQGQAPSAGEVPTTIWLVWSHEHNAWWRPNNAGYTVHITAAGRYTKAEADRICDTRSPSRFKDDPPPEVAVIAPEAEAQLERETIALRQRVEQWKQWSEYVRRRFTEETGKDLQAQAS